MRLCLVVLYSQNYGTGIRGHWATMNLQIVLNTPKTPFLNQATQRELAKFSYPRNSIDLSCHLKSEVTPPLPFPGKKTAVKDEEDKNWALVHFGSRPSHMFPENA